MISGIRPEDKECPLSSALDYVGDWWTLLILHDAFDGYTRFDEFERNTRASTSVLSKRLAGLVAKGILEKRQYQDRPVRHEYLLTEFGWSLRPVIVALAAWTNARLAPEERSMILVDPSGREMDPVIVDRRSGQVLDDATRFRFAAGPAAGEEMQARYHRNVPEDGGASAGAAA